MDTMGYVKYLLVTQKCSIFLMQYVIANIANVTSEHRTPSDHCTMTLTFKSEKKDLNSETYL